MVTSDSRRRNLALLFVSSILALLMAELVLRLAPVKKTSLADLLTPVDDSRGYVLRPYAHIKYQLPERGRLVTWQINEQGMRDDTPVGKDTRPKKFRIATYGDSEVFGWSVEIEDTFQKQLESLRGDADVVNYGVPGYNVGNVAEHVERTAALNNLHLVIYVVNPNDFGPPLSGTAKSFYTVTAKSMIARHVAYLMLVLKSLDYTKYRYDPERIRIFIHELLRIKRFCEKEDLELVLAFLDGADASVLGLDEELSGYFLAPEYRERRVIDLSLAAQQYPKIDSHLSREAHQLIAVTLAKSLRLKGVRQSIDSSANSVGGIATRASATSNIVPGSSPHRTIGLIYSDLP